MKPERRLEIIMNDAVRIASIGTALPPCEITQKKALSLLNDYYKDELTPRSFSVIDKLFNNPSIKSRSFAFSSVQETSLLKNEDPDKRIIRFTNWTVNLSSRAILSALEPLSIKTSNIDCLIVNTCTGYICPGITSYLVEKLNLRPGIRVYDMVGAGCGGAIPNLQLGCSLAADGEIVVCVSVEICSATFEMDNDMNLLVSNALFGDGAAAVVLWNRPGGIRLVDSESLLHPRYREHIRYIHKNGRLHNHLSSTLPGILKETVPPVVSAVVSRNHLLKDQIKHWAIHPGGGKILDSIQSGLDLTDKQMIFSRHILEKHGNMSSPTVLFILKEIMLNGSTIKGDWGIITSFGAGFSIHSLLLHWE